MVSLRLRSFLLLNLACHCNSPDRSTKSTPLSTKDFDCLYTKGFRFSFTPLPGFFSTFLHSTSTLSVIKEYLGLGGGPPGFRQGFSCPDVLWIPLQVFWFRVQDFHFLWRNFPDASTTIASLRLWSTTPQCTHRGLASYPFARRYSGNRCFFLFLPLLRCFSSRRSPCITMDSLCSD